MDVPAEIRNDTSNTSLEPSCSVTVWIRMKLSVNASNVVEDFSCYVQKANVKPTDSTSSNF